MKNNHRFILAFFWSIVASLIIGYIVYQYGGNMEILTLIIGLLSGSVVGGIFGHYFSSSHKNTNDEAGEEEKTI